VSSNETGDAGKSRRRRTRRTWAKCSATGKVRFRDHDSATKALVEAKISASWNAVRDLPSSRAETRTYRCPHCRGWHLTSRLANNTNTSTEETE
jgi:hypothetical protein